MPESPAEKLARRLGSVTLSPMTPVIAGSITSWTITLTVGSAGVDEGGTIKIAQRFASDGQDPQFTDPQAAAFSSVSLKSTDPNTKLRARFDRKAHDRPWMAATIIDVYDGSLSPGDTVTLILGDRSQGSPGGGGIRAQSFQESHHEFRVFVDPTNACLARAIPNCPTIPIIPGPPVELICIVPTQTQLNTPTRIHTKAQDQWGNPTQAPKDTALTYEGTGAVNIKDHTLTFTTPGTGRIRATATNMQCTSNPVTSYQFPITNYQKFWGDLHAQSDATVGTGSEEEYFAFARDWAFLDFTSHQGNDFQVTDENWKKLNDTVRQFHKDHHFVVFPGWEWSGNTTVGGDRNVWYLEEDMPIFRSSHWQVPHIPETDQSPAETVADLFDRVRQLPREKVLLGSHVGGRYADIRPAGFFDEELGPLVELVSCWGVFEWMLWDAFDKNYIVGIVCNSDGHKGRPGAEGPGAGQFGIPNGLTCVLAHEKTRQSIWQALKARRCYGTTGARIDIDFTIDGHPMGTILDNTASHENIALRGNARPGGGVAAEPNATHKLHAKVLATAPLESIEIFQGKKVIHTWQPPAFKSLGNSNHIRVSWKGSRIRGRGRRANWDGKIILTNSSEGGAKILSATSHFDTPIDKITPRSETPGGGEISFKSQTTGDTDWIDLILSPYKAGDGIAGPEGTLTLDSKVGKFSVNLADLTSTAPSKTFPAGGLDMQVKIERYPAALSDLAAEFSLDIAAPKNPQHKTPIFLKVTQSDGHLAWTSPIYLT